MCNSCARELCEEDYLYDMFSIGSISSSLKEVGGLMDANFNYFAVVLLFFCCVLAPYVVSLVNIVSYC